MSWYPNSKYTLLVAWGIVLFGFWCYTWFYHVDRGHIFQQLIDHQQYQRYSYLGVVLVYCIRPFFRIPVARLSVVVGTMYDFGLGLILATIGENISASVGYGLSKYFKFHIPLKYQGFFRILDHKQSILAVFLSRLGPVPDDINNYGRAMIGVGFIPYLIGTILGNLIFTSINVWMGSTLSASWIHIISHPSILWSNHELRISIIVYIVIIIASGIGIKYLMIHKKGKSKSLI